MQYLTLASTLLSASLLVSAAPTTSDPLTRRACQVAYPQAASYPIQYDISRDADGNEVPKVITFNIPSGSYGCQLEANFPAGYSIASEGNSKVNVFSGTGSLFGTVTFASSPVAATKYVINSATCEDTMMYQLKIASKDQAGRVAFEGTKEAGLSMTYNC